MTNVTHSRKKLFSLIDQIDKGEGNGLGVRRRQNRKVRERVSSYKHEDERANWKQVGLRTLKVSKPPPVTHFLQEACIPLNIPKEASPTRNQVFKYKSYGGHGSSNPTGVDS